jgi:hypothetical protein
LTHYIPGRRRRRPDREPKRARVQGGGDDRKDVGEWATCGRVVGTEWSGRASVETLELPSAEVGVLLSWLLQLGFGRLGAVEACAETVGVWETTEMEWKLGLAGRRLLITISLFLLYYTIFFLFKKNKVNSGIFRTDR